MNLTDLQHTLAARADDVDDRLVLDRLDAVHGRVHAVRRRRAAVALVALAVLGVGVVAWLPSRIGPEPARRPTVGGHTAPATMTSLGYGYDFTSAVTGDGSARLRLSASATPRIVSWGGSGREVRLRADQDLGTGTTPYVSDRSTTAFDDFVVVPTGVPLTLRATGSGRTALAVYALARPAPGLTADGVTWRDSVAGGQLIAAAIGRPGQAEVTTSFTMPDSGVSYADLCTHAPAGTWFHVSFDATSDDSGFSFGPCDRGAPSYDAAGASSYAFTSLADDDGRDYRPGESVPVRIWATHGDKGPLVEDPDLLIAAGFYDAPAAAASIAADPVAPEVEADGHLWRFTAVRQSDPGQRRLSTRVTASGTPLLVRAVAVHTGRGDVSAQIQGITGQGAHNDTPDGTSTFSLGELTHRAVSVRISVSPGSERTVLAVITYEQVD